MVKWSTEYCIYTENMFPEHLQNTKIMFKLNCFIEADFISQWNILKE